MGETVVRSSSRSLSIALVVVLGAWGCESGAGGPPPPDEWAFELPPGVEVISHPEVVEASRDGDPIGLEEDLVITERPGDDNTLFYRIRGVQVDADGRIYVADAGNHRIQVFGADGGYLRTLGRKGEGPGELGDSFSMAVAGDRVVAFDYNTRRLIRWDLGGEHVGDVRLAEEQFLRGLWGLSDGQIVAVHSQRSEDGLDTERVERYRRDGEMVADLATVIPGGVSARAMVGETSFYISMGPGATYAVGPGERIYAASVDEYRILSLTAVGEPRWALWVPWPRPPIDPEVDLAQTIGEIQESIPDIDPSAFEWPERFPALDAIHVDGHGHVYVFPLFGDRAAYFRDAPEERDDQAVDVYSPDGDRLYSGTMPYVRWLDARGDFLFSSREDVSTGAVEVVRYRLVEPF